MLNVLLPLIPVAIASVLFVFTVQFALSLSSLITEPPVNAPALNERTILQLLGPSWLLHCGYVRLELGRFFPPLRHLESFSPRNFERLLMSTATLFTQKSKMKSKLKSCHYRTISELLSIYLVRK